MCKNARRRRRHERVANRADGDLATNWHRIHLNGAKTLLPATLWYKVNTIMAWRGQNCTFMRVHTVRNAGKAWLFFISLLGVSVSVALKSRLMRAEVTMNTYTHTQKRWLIRPKIPNTN